MVAVNSTMQALGSAAPDFDLPNTNDSAMRNVALPSFKSKPLLVMFICNHCPFVIHLIKELSIIANQAQEQGFGVVAISSNDVANYPQDGPEKMSKFALDHNMKFAYLYDQSQDIAKAFGAACTPDFFVYDRQHKLQYRGQMDSSRPGNNIDVSGDDLKKALIAVLNNEPPNANQTPSIGCNIKWIAGNQPDYF